MNALCSLFSRCAQLLLVLIVFAAACGSSSDSAPSSIAADSDAGSAAATSRGGNVDQSLERFDVDCSAEGLGTDGASEFIVAHYVVDGNLGGLCFGDKDPTLIRAWEELAVITPGAQLADIGLFGGFISGYAAGGDETTLAFVNSLDDDGSLFQMSVNLDSYDEDPNEALLTMAHEFSHIFTALSPQLDRSVEPQDCRTYYSGEGCYTSDSIMAEWVRLFWADGLADEIDPSREASASGGEDRCAVNPSFFGPYAASNPEEDFAESFSAFVYQLDTRTDEQQAKLDWIEDQAGLREFRDRAIAAGVGPLRNNFEDCGRG